MGYYTRYDLSIHHPDIGWTELLEHDAYAYVDVHKLKEEYIPEDVEPCLIPFFAYVTESLGGKYWSPYSEEPHKWYNHDKDMLDLSKRFPDMTFELSGEGEESGDIWRKRYRNGKVYTSKVVISFEPWPEDALVSGKSKDDSPHLIKRRW